MPYESSQKKLSRIRPPRVHITYDVEVGDAMQTKELPMVIGVVADLSGHTIRPDNALREQSFIQIDRDSLNDVLKAIKPSLSLDVANRLGVGASTLRIDVDFSQMRDFEPDSLVHQIEPLRQLLAIRTQLNELRNRMIGNNRLEDALSKLVQDRTLLLELSKPALLKAESI